MSFITDLFDHLKLGVFKRMLSLDNLTQPSTWKGAIRMSVAAGVFTLTPELQDILVQLILQIIATGTLATGVIDAIRNEKKKPADPLPWAEPK